MNKDYSVPKIPVTIQVLRRGTAGFQNCRIFLSAASRHHNGRETIAEFLNSGLDFLPVELEGKVNILNLRHIMAFRDVSESMSGDGRHILLTLKDRKLFTVQLGEILPESHNRTQDFLNTDELFVEFIFESAKLFVNKTMILSAVDQ